MTWQAWVALALLALTVSFGTAVAVLTQLINEARHTLPAYRGDYDDRWETQP